MTATHDPANLPDWVWDLLDALDVYEGEHPPLYRWLGGSDYEQWPCFWAFLEERGATPPDEVAALAQFRRRVLRDARQETA